MTRRPTSAAGEPAILTNESDAAPELPHRSGCTGQKLLTICALGTPKETTRRLGTAHSDALRERAAAPREWRDLSVRLVRTRKLCRALQTPKIGL
jgi:hypothetical protein